MSLIKLLNPIDFRCATNLKDFSAETFKNFYPHIIIKMEESHKNISKLYEKIYNKIKHPYFMYAFEDELETRIEKYLDKAIKELKSQQPRLAEILKLRKEGHSLREVGKNLSISCQRVIELEKKAIERISRYNFYKPHLDELLIKESEITKLKLLEYGNLGKKILEFQEATKLKLKIELEKEFVKLINYTLKSDKQAIYMNLPIGEFGFSSRVLNCFYKADINNLSDLLSFSERDLLGIRGFGKKSLEEVKTTLQKYGFKLSFS